MMEDYSKYTTQELVEKIYNYETQLEYLPELIGDLYRMKINIRKAIDELISCLWTNEGNVTKMNLRITFSLFLYYKCKKLPNKDILLPKIRDIFYSTYNEYVENLDVNPSMKSKILEYKEKMYVNGVTLKLTNLD